MIALVQPHRHARVQALWRELGASVAGADLVVVTEVYAAAQEPIPGVTGRLVADGVLAAAPDVPTSTCRTAATWSTSSAAEVATRRPGGDDGLRRRVDDRATPTLERLGAGA